MWYSIYYTFDIHSTGINDLFYLLRVHYNIQSDNGYLHAF